MKRPSILALALFALPACALPACAQRGGHGGFSGGVAHAAPAARSGFSGSGPRGFAGTPHNFASGPRNVAAGSRSFASGPRLASGYRGRIGAPGARPAFYSNNRSRRPFDARYRSGYGRGGYGYGLGTGVYLAPYELGYPDTTGDLNPNDAMVGIDSGAPAPAYPDSAPDGSGGYMMPPPPADPGAPQPYPQATQLYPQPQAAPAAPLEPEAAVTLIYKDGRSEQIHNYALTRTTLYVTDKQHHRDIPLDSLDLAATVKTNHEAGVSFQLPQSH